MRARPLSSMGSSMNCMIPPQRSQEPPYQHLLGVLRAVRVCWLVWTAISLLPSTSLARERAHVPAPSDDPDRTQWLVSWSPNAQFDDDESLRSLSAATINGVVVTPQVLATYQATLARLHVDIYIDLTDSQGLESAEVPSPSGSWAWLDSPEISGVVLADRANLNSPETCAALRNLQDVAQDKPRIVASWSLSVRCPDVADILLFIPLVSPSDSLPDPNYDGFWTALSPTIPERDTLGMNVPGSRHYQARALEHLAGNPPAWIHLGHWTAGDNESIEQTVIDSRRGRTPTLDVLTWLKGTSPSPPLGYLSDVPEEHPLSSIRLGALGLLVLLASLFLSYGRAQNMVVRYFGGHRFYREAVRAGREDMPVVTATLVLVYTVLLWLCLVTAKASYSAPDALRVTRFLALDGLDGWAFVLVASLVPLSLCLQAGLAKLLSWDKQVRFQQTLMLATWSRWGILLALPVLLLATDPIPSPYTITSVLLVLGVLWAVGHLRMVLDWTITFRIPFYRALILFLVTDALLIALLHYANHLATALGGVGNLVDLFRLLGR